jgi:hypothetical protein
MLTIIVPKNKTSFTLPRIDLTLGIFFEAKYSSSMTNAKPNPIPMKIPTKSIDFYTSYRDHSWTWLNNHAFILSLGIASMLRISFMFFITMLMFAGI